MSEPPVDPPVEPTPVEVSGPMRRSYSPAMFADLVRPDVRIVSRTVGPTWTLTFAGTEPGPALSEAEAAAVWARMESTDDADQSRRAALRAAAAGLAADDPLRLTICYVLGDE